MASRAAPVPGPMAGQGTREAMAGQGAWAAMVGLPPRPRPQPPPLRQEPYYTPKKKFLGGSRGLIGHLGALWKCGLLGALWKGGHCIALSRAITGALSGGAGTAGERRRTCVGRSCIKFIF